MNHAEAEITGAVERYLLGELSEDEALRFEEHYFTCTECADDIRVSSMFLDNLKAVLREPYAVARLDAPAAAPVKARSPAWFPAASIAAAVTLAVGAGYQNLVQIPHLRNALAMASAVESPPVYYLSETRSEADSSTVVAPPGVRHVSLVLNNIPGKTYPYYDCELRDASGGTVQRFRVPVMTDREEWQVRLPVQGLSSQRYTLEVRGASDASSPAAQSVAEYHFGLQIR